jgi:chromosome segregation ATPase
MMRVFVLAICGGLLCPAGAQAQTPDMLGELLKEVRALRIAMERAATVGARIQLLVARVQMQEQRITELSRRAVSVREELSKIDSDTANVASMVKRFEGPTANMPPEDRAAFESQIEMFKTQLANAEKRRQELLNEEAMLSQQISADQGRWTDVNNQLDQLERSLTLPKQ